MRLPTTAEEWQRARADLLRWAEVLQRDGCPVTSAQVKLAVRLADETAKRLKTQPKEKEP